MKFRQMDSVIFYAFNSADNEWINSLYVIFEILLEFHDIAVFVSCDILCIIFYDTNIIKVSISFACCFCKCQSYFSAFRSSKVYIHILEIAASVNGCTGIAVCICFYKVLCDRTLCIICSQDFISAFYGHRCFAVTSVVHTYEYCILLTRFQICQFLCHSYITAQFQHRIAVLTLSDLSCSITNFCPVCSKRSCSTVKSGIYDMHSLAPSYIDITFLTFVYNIRYLSFCCKCQLAIYDINSLLICLTFIGQTIYFNIL